MKSLKRPIKKILTGVTCLIVVAATVALCSVAYFRETTQPENKAFTFTSVRVSQETSFQSKAPAAIFDGYDDKGYYVSLDRMSQKTNLQCSTKVTNEGKKPIAIYAVVVYPYANTQNDLFSNVVPVVGSKWIKIATTKSKNKNATAIFAYQELVQPGQTLEGEDALNMTITVNGTNETTLETAKLEVEDGYRKARIQTSMIGIQDPVEILQSVNGYGEYNWSLNDIDYGAKAMLTEAWNYGINDEIQYYVAMNIKKIDDEINDDSKLK